MRKEEAIARLQPTQRGWIEDFRDQLHSSLGARLRDLRLFGSLARGEGEKESDIDILVLIAGLDEDTLQAVVDTAYEISAWIAPLVEDFDRYHSPRGRATGLYKEIRMDSVRL